MQQLSLFSPSAFLPPHLAEECERTTDYIAAGIRRLGSLEALTGHLAHALITQERRYERRGEEWPRGLTFIPRRRAAILVLGLLPVRRILASMRSGIAAPLVQRAYELRETYQVPGDGQMKLLEWLVHVAEREGRCTPLHGRVLMPDVVPGFDVLWLDVLRQRDRRIAELMAMKAAGLDAVGGVSREQLERRVARWDARMIGLATLLPPEINEATYERYLRLVHDIPEPVFGSYGPASGGVLL